MLLLRWLTKFLLVVLALLFIANFLPGFSVDNFYTALIVAFVLGVFNLTIRPVLFILTLPITILTFGIFAFVLNGLLLWFVASFIEGFEVSGFVPAFIGAIIISAFSWIGNRLLER